MSRRGGGFSVCLDRRGYWRGNVRPNCLFGRGFCRRIASAIEFMRTGARGKWDAILRIDRLIELVFLI